MGTLGVASPVLQLTAMLEALQRLLDYRRVCWSQPAGFFGLPGICNRILVSGTEWHCKFDTQNAHKKRIALTLLLLVCLTPAAALLFSSHSFRGSCSKSRPSKPAKNPPRKAKGSWN